MEIAAGEERKQSAPGLAFLALLVSSEYGSERLATAGWPTNEGIAIEELENNAIQGVYAVASQSKVPRTPQTGEQQMVQQAPPGFPAGPRQLHHRLQGILDNSKRAKLTNPILTRGTTH